MPAHATDYHRLYKDGLATLIVDRSRRRDQDHPGSVGHCLSVAAPMAEFGGSCRDGASLDVAALGRRLRVFRRSKGSGEERLSRGDTRRTELVRAFDCLADLRPSRQARKSAANVVLEP